MKMLSWSEEERRWYAAAEQASAYFDKLADEVARDLPAGAMLHDIGCGNGALALRLSFRDFGVIAVDSNPLAVGETARRVHAQGAAVDTILADYHSLSGHIAYPVFCLCGQIIEDFPLLQQWGSLCATVVALDDTLLPFKLIPTPRRALCAQTIGQWLLEQEIPHTARKLTEAFGQPFGSVADATAFMQWHNPGASLGEIASWLDERLIFPADGTEGVCYLEHQKRVVIYKIYLKSDRTGECV